MNAPVFSLVSCVAMVHGVRAAMKSLKITGTDFSTAKGMDPKSFFEVMGMFLTFVLFCIALLIPLHRIGRGRDFGCKSWRDGFQAGVR